MSDVVSIPDAPEVPAAREGLRSTPAARVGHRLWAWLRVLVGAFLIALALRAFAFEAYTIPSSSMEGTLLVGDYLFVSKLHYGARTPVTLGVPFTDVYLHGAELPWTRLPGLSHLRRGDVVVFNFPPERAPLDRKEYYIKRLVGLPGDTVRVVAKRVVVDGDPQPTPPTARQLWRVRLASDTVVATRVLPEREVRGELSREDAVWLVEASAAEAERLRRLSAVAEVEPYVREPGDGSAGFPLGTAFSLDDYGPVVVPARGRAVRLDDRTWPVYRDVIARYEGVSAQRVADGFEVGGALTDTYTFRQDYFFVMGDNRDDSADSRTWGFVPADHVVGKAVLIYFSWDGERGAPRWDRILQRVP